QGGWSEWFPKWSSTAMQGTLYTTFPAALGLCATLLLLGAGTARGDFPEVSELPSRPDLPDPLFMFNGKRVATKEQWFKQRRPELKALFQHYMYGYMPAAPRKVGAKVEREDRKAFDGKATLKEVTITFGPPKAPRIHLLLVVPNRRKGPAPAFLGLNFHGNHALLKDPKVRLPAGWVPKGTPGSKDNRATSAGRGREVQVWAIEQSIDRGYAVATFYCGDIDPDRPDVRGVQPHYYKKGQTKPGPHDWGTIAAWAWGLMRAVDYLETEKGIDKKRIAVVGHS